MSAKVATAIVALTLAASRVVTRLLARTLGVFAAASVLAGLSGCVSLFSEPSADQRAFASIDAGTSTLAEVEAGLGEPDYVMASHNVVGYVDDATGASVPALLGCDRGISVIQYEDDLVARAWAGLAPGDLLAWEDGVPAELRAPFWRPSSHPLSDTLSVGASRRADVEAVAGAPYYELPQHDLAVYIADAAVIKREQDCAAGGYATPDCRDRFVTTDLRTGCTLSIGAGGPGGNLVHLVQYDNAGRVVRTDTVTRGRSGFRLDKWAGGATGRDATDADERLVELRRRLETLGPEGEAPDACGWLLTAIEDGSEDTLTGAKRPDMFAIARCTAALRAAAEAAEDADDF